MITAINPVFSNGEEDEMTELFYSTRFPQFENINMASDPHTQNQVWFVGEHIVTRSGMPKVWSGCTCGWKPGKVACVHLSAAEKERVKEPIN